MSNDDILMNQLWKIVHRFKLYEILNVRNDRHETSLHITVSMNNIILIDDLIKNGTDVNAIDHKGNTVLHIAVERNNDDLVSVILEKSKNLDLNIQNFDGYTPLHLAVIQNNIMLVKILHSKAISSGTSIFESNEGKHGNNALHIAIESGSKEVADYIIKNKCTSPTRCNLSGHTALYLARTTNEFELINLMQMHSICDMPHYGNDDEKDEDNSSKDSFDSITDISSTPPEKLLSIEEKIDEITQTFHAERRFDDGCFIELSELLNKDAKWKSVAKELGYEEFIKSWQILRNPTKVLLIYTEVIFGIFLNYCRW